MFESEGLVIPFSAIAEGKPLPLSISALAIRPCGPICYFHQSWTSTLATAGILFLPAVAEGHALCFSAITATESINLSQA